MPALAKARRVLLHASQLQWAANAPGLPPWPPLTAQLGWGGDRKEETEHPCLAPAVGSAQQVREGKSLRWGLSPQASQFQWAANAPVLPPNYLLLQLSLRGFNSPLCRPQMWVAGVKVLFSPLPSPVPLPPDWRAEALLPQFCNSP